MIQHTSGSKPSQILHLAQRSADTKRADLAFNSFFLTHFPWVVGRYFFREPRECRGAHSKKEPTIGLGTSAPFDVIQRDALRVLVLGRNWPLGWSWTSSSVPNGSSGGIAVKCFPSSAWTFTASSWAWNRTIDFRGPCSSPGKRPCEELLLTNLLSKAPYPENNHIWVERKYYFGISIWTLCYHLTLKLRYEGKVPAILWTLPRKPIQRKFDCTLPSFA